jgi:hypothetical protein
LRISLGDFRMRVHVDGDERVDIHRQGSQD